FELSPFTSRDTLHRVSSRSPARPPVCPPLANVSQNAGRASGPVLNSHPAPLPLETAAAVPPHNDVHELSPRTPTTIPLYRTRRTRICLSVESNSRTPATLGA